MTTMVDPGHPSTWIRSRNGRRKSRKSKGHPPSIDQMSKSETEKDSSLATPTLPTRTGFNTSNSHGMPKGRHSSLRIHNRRNCSLDFSEKPVEPKPEGREDVKEAETGDKETSNEQQEAVCTEGNEGNEGNEETSEEKKKEEKKPQPSVPDPWTKDKILSDWRRFSLDLSPKVF